MPLGWERINVKKTVPNHNIVFIKPLPGPTESTAKDFLERIAAQCLPIMNNSHLSVASLEEYQPNREFWGRNFNAGEVIQLVLRSPSTGQWLPFKFVQMVMMHELAHNKQMNHSSAFHKVRIGFTNEMKALWERGYTGDGLWGRGKLLENGAFDRAELGEGEILPEHLCGGTFRSRGSKKRKAKPKITYRERQERRIRKKFGTNGVALGADDKVKAKLEKGKKPAGKPRVAGSSRGRELRAAAALARFETAKEEPQYKDEDLVTDSEAESDREGDVIVKSEPTDAVDIDGSWLLDPKGFPMVKVCEDEDKDDDYVKDELLELQQFDGQARRQQLSEVSPQLQPTALKSPSLKPSRKVPAQVQLPASSGKTHVTVKEAQTSSVSEDKVAEPKKTAEDKIPNKEDQPNNIKSGSSIADGSCPICSMKNEPTALTCMACSNVLKPDFVPNSWRCKSETCQGSEYINAGDMGVCGVCGTRKSSESV